MDGPAVLSMPPLTSSQKSAQSPQPQSHPKQNQVQRGSTRGQLTEMDWNFKKRINEFYETD